MTRLGLSGWLCAHKNSSLESFIVEFTGIAGTGKTALAERVREHLREKGISCRPGKVGRLALVESLVSPCWILGSSKALVAIFRGQSGDPPGILECWWRWGRTEVKLWGHYFEPGVHLIDHGFFQTFRSIYPGCSRLGMYWLAHALGRCSTIPHLVVFLEADATAIIERRANRAKQLGPAELDPAKVQRSVNRIPQYRDTLLRMAAEREDLEVMILENGAGTDLNALAGLVADQVLVLTRGGSRGGLDRGVRHD